ncbi:MAG: M23 family metallopeptidase [Bacteroidia bacterium]
MKKKLLILFLIILLIGFLLPEKVIIPVENASARDWHPETFWYYPWGKSVVHKGIDIFAEEGRPVISADHGLVVFNGELRRGGQVVVVMGPKWHFHYYAHLRSADAGLLSWKSRGEKLGEVGSTGNAAGKPPHLHYSIFTPIPYFWRIDGSPMGWAKMFFLNPIQKMQHSPL